ncbi:MAG: T9SS type A sorting domain-containing protein [Bacteroidetes bacterium]|nr:T9SS type A sorting domain-containing protein [Bacteroidota bacterium]
MKKWLKFLVCILVVGVNFAQTDELNLKKYWKFRNSFRENFVKIGPLSGEGLPAGRRNPGACVDNIDFASNKGWMSWGDGMIRQGHYIGFLATEYRLLKNHGQDVTAVLNELYYALSAINRVDGNAEQIITTLNDALVDKPQNLNGFYLRDDVPENFYQNWQNSPIKCRCTEGSIYENNNAAKSNFGGYYAHSKTSAWSIPSLDQMTSLLVGLSVCNKLLEDGIYVQPTPSDPVMDLRNEVKQITNRIISYAYNHNWFLLDEWGWPVNNGGGELLLTSYPITVIGQNIVGNDYSSVMKRHKKKYKAAQHYHCLPTQEEKDAYWETLNLIQKAQVNDYSDYNPWPLNIDGLSNFEAFQSSDGAEEISTDLLQVFWEDVLPENWPAMYNDWQDDYKFNETMPAPISAIEFDSLNVSDYNNTIMFNLGVASGLFSNSQVFEWGTTTHNYQLVLIDALLKNQTPAFGGKPFFQNFLNSMPIYGGFKFSGTENWEDPLSDKQLLWPGGWGGEYKWTHFGEAYNANGFEGQFSPLDYMYFHNLYYLVFENVLPDYDEDHGCICSGVGDAVENLPIVTDIPAYSGDFENFVSGGNGLLNATKFKLSFLEFCMENTFQDFTGAQLTTTYNLGQFFPEYHDLGIALNEYQTNHFTIKNLGVLNIDSRLVICEGKVLTVENGGIINLDEGEIRINPTAQLIIQGDVNIAPGTKVIVKEGAKIVIKNGGVLNNQGYIQLQAGASLEYEDGATLRMNNNESEVHFDGGDLVIRENADFTFDISGAASGQLRFSQWGPHIIAEDNTSILLQGNDETDSILVLDKDADFWSNSTGLNWIGIHTGKVIFHENARLVSIQDFNSNHVHYDGLSLNRGLETFDHSVIANAIFDEVPIYAPLFYKASGTFNLSNSVVNNTTANSVIRIKGMGYNISETSFNCSAYYIVDGQNTTQYSTILSSTFNGDLSTVGIIDNSAAEIEIRKCDFNTLYAGVHKLNGRANLKCNNFINFKYAGAVAQGNCLLDMSSLSHGGYNTFQKNSAATGPNVALWNAQYIYLGYGYNYFDEQGSLPIIQGTLAIGYPPLWKQYIQAKRNRWNAANTAPPTSDISLTSYITGGAITAITSEPQSASCPITDVIGNDVVSLAPTDDYSKQIITTPHFSGANFATAINYTISESERYNPSKNDLTALSLFEEVLTYNVASNSANTWLTDYAYQYMKYTVQHTFRTGRISRADNMVSFHSGVQSYVNVLNHLTTGSVTSSNYQQMFYLEMDKVHLFHQLGKYDMALMILYNLESCGLDSVEQKHLNHWKFELETEYAKTTYGPQAEMLDTAWADTTNYLIPVHRSFGNFGSQIIDPATIQFYSCSAPRGQVSDGALEEFEFSIYPNPSNGICNITYDLPEGSEGFVKVYGIDGKEIKTFKCQSGPNYEVVDISNVSSGIYYYSYLIDGAVVQSGKLIIE